MFSGRLTSTFEQVKSEIFADLVLSHYKSCIHRESSPRFQTEPLLKKTLLDAMYIHDKTSHSTATSNSTHTH